MNMNEREFSGRYCAGMQLSGIADVKIKDAYRQLKYDLDNLHTAFEDKAIGETEYCMYKIRSMEYFNENLSKAVRGIRTGQI